MTDRDNRIETLTEAPNLIRLFAAAALTGRHRSGDLLPDLTLRLADTRVDRTDLIEYERLCGFPVGDTLPATYPHIVGFPLQMALVSRRDFPVPLMGIVHLENTITTHRHIDVGEALTIEVRAENLRPHRKGRLVDLVTDVEAGGERVWSGRSTYLSRGKGSPDAVSGVGPPPFPAAPPVARWRLPGDLGRDYARVSGDVNPIHLSALTAKALGFPRAIAHGMFTYARVLAALGRVATGPGTSHVWFAKPVLLPSTVELVLANGTGADTPTVAGLRSAKHPDLHHLTVVVTG